jgi:hypothetical protein
VTASDREFWSRVHERLDAREDPLGDRVVVESALANPERRDALLATLLLLDACQHLPADVGASRSRAPLVRRAAAAAAVLAILGLTWLATRSHEATLGRPVPPAIVRRFPRDADAVVSWAVTVTRREGDASTCDSVGSEGAVFSSVGTSRHDSDRATVAFHQFMRFPR